MSSVEGPEDLTRRERREHARAQRKALEEAQASGAAQRKRLIQLGGVIGVVVVILVVILLTTGGGTKKGIPKGRQKNQTVAAVAAVLQGIPQSGPTLGNPKAPVIMQYFGDLECPVCQRFTLGALPSLIERYVRPGKLKIEFRALESATANPATFGNQQIAALAAGKQNLGWYYIELFYHEQGQEGSGYVTESYLQELAQQVPGLNLTSWSAARNDTALANEIISDQQAASQVGFTGTPAFLIGKTTNAMQKLEYTTPSLTDASSFDSAIETLLKR